MNSVRAIKRLRDNRPINFREKEKEILDQIIGPDRYDSRIRPSGMSNDTSTYLINTLINSLASNTINNMMYSCKRKHVFFVQNFLKAMLNNGLCTKRIGKNWCNFEPPPFSQKQQKFIRFF